MRGNPERVDLGQSYGPAKAERVLLCSPRSAGFTYLSSCPSGKEAEDAGDNMKGNVVATCEGARRGISHERQLRSPSVRLPLGYQPRTARGAALLSSVAALDVL